MNGREVHKGCGGAITFGHEVWRCQQCGEVCSVADVAGEHEIALFDSRRPLPTVTELPELIDLAAYCNTPEAGTVEYGLAKGLLAVLTDPALYEAAKQMLTERQKAIVP